MRMSIRLRTIVVMNLLVVALGTGIGWLASQVAGEVVEERLVRETVRNTSQFLQDKSLPFSDALMTYLHQMFRVHFVAVERGSNRILGSSLPPAQTDDLREHIHDGSRAGAVTVDGNVYRMDFHEIVPRNARTRQTQPLRVYALVPPEQFRDARQRASRRIRMLALPAIAAATLLAFGLSITITGPIHRLADEMDGMAAAASPPHGARRGPSEVVRLAHSFDHLIARLGEMQRQLARSERLVAIGTVAASVAHELRNPLSGIKMNLRVLRDELAEPGGRPESLGVMVREVERMELYLEELMALASGPADPGDPDRPEPQDLPAILLTEAADSALELLAGRCTHAGVTVRREYDPSVPAVRADAGQIRQVLVNLIVNALEAMPGGGRLQVAIRAAEGRPVRLSVADTGAGVRVEAGTDVFEPFTSTKHNSAGLGLYISKQLLARQGGRMGYHNTDSGAAFWIELPADDGGTPSAQP